MRQRIFIIGGSGFVGKNMVRFLHTKYDLYVYDRFVDADFFALFPDVKVAPIALEKEMVPIEDGTPDFLINLAADVIGQRDISLMDGMIQNNLRILMNLYQRFQNCAGKMKLVIQFGSLEEYGPNFIPYKETDRECPLSPYALAKQLTTNTAVMLYRNYGFPVCVVRPSNLFGRYQNSSKFIPYIAKTLLSGEDLNVTPCGQKRDFLYIDDFVDFIGKILENPHRVQGEIINVGSGRSESLQDIIEFLRIKTSSSSRVNYGTIPYRENEAMQLIGDVSKLREIIGSKEQPDFYKRLEEYITCDI
ncbi:MAG: NAD(P)-dependent oxidoreductase [Bacteroidales bacterium]|nr:NAD(P)-dependent oxidoreductase [Bacteroidales bacterium]